MPKNPNQHHAPVLLTEVIEYLSPAPGERYLDLTAGYGGHSKAILSKTKAKATLVDRDEQAHLVLKQLFQDNPDIELIDSDFYVASKLLVEKPERYDLILADIGVSSPHLDNPSRGFSLKQEGPLDMRMDQRQEASAQTLLNQSSAKEIEQILRSYGDEPKARKIAQLIVDSRPITSTTQLAELVRQAWPGYSKVHPATRTFQAIRIAVNDEIGQLKRSLPLWVELLAPGGRLGVISFHSLEDREVKKFFKTISGDRYDTECDLVTKKAVVASANEIVNNPRARSAKLRVVRKRK